MKGGTLQITWHGSDPVLTLDFHSLSGLLATGGADHDIKFWTLHEADGASLPSATFHSCLSYHTAAVNVVRFSVTGDQLASGADGGEIILWKLTENPEASSMWKFAKNLRFHVKDVLDLQWSSDGTLLVSGSVDNTVIIWDIVKGNPQQVLKDHMHYVQGVAWDPIGQYIASISGDRTCRIYSNKPQNPKGKNQDRHFSCQSVLVKAEVPKQEPKQEDDATKVAAAKLNLFHDETLPSFFRRLAWSPDGSFLLVPAGIHKFPSESVLTNTAFLISRKDLSRPAVQLPGASKPVVAVRFCPIMFSCHPNVDKDSSDIGIFKLPYRLVFAVATINSLFVYDTQSAHPLAVLAGIHYAAITDIAWSCDGKFLAVSSQDGFCTLVAFDQEELGSPLPLSELPSYVAKFLPLAKDKAVGLHARSYEVAKSDAPSQQGIEANGSSVSPGTSSQSYQEANASSGSSPKKPRRITPVTMDAPSQRDIEANGSSVSSGTSLQLQQEANASSGSSPKKPRRITPVTMDAPSQQGIEANVSSVSPGTPLQPHQEANASSGSSPKKPRRITPVAMDPPSQRGIEANVSSVSPGTSLQPYQEANASSGSSPKKPRRITPVTISEAANASSGSSPKKPRRITPVTISEAANASFVNSGTSLQPDKEANMSSKLVMQASATQVEPDQQESQHAGCINVASSRSCVVSDIDKIEKLQSSPKRPRRITPVAIMVSCDTLQTTDASRNDDK